MPELDEFFQIAVDGVAVGDGDAEFGVFSTCLRAFLAL